MNNTDITKAIKILSNDLLKLAEFLAEGMALLNEKIERLTKEVEDLKKSKL